VTLPPAPGAAAPLPSTPEEIAALPFERGREVLMAVVAQLESGRLTLDQSMELWRIGEAVAAHMETQLDGYRAQFSQLTAQTP
jgi:exodeoxyribonuclease VII small subunit